MIDTIYTNLVRRTIAVDEDEGSDLEIALTLYEFDPGKFCLFLSLEETFGYGWPEEVVDELILLLGDDFDTNNRHDTNTMDWSLDLSDYGSALAIIQKIVKKFGQEG